MNKEALIDSTNETNRNGKIAPSSPSENDRDVEIDGMVSFGNPQEVASDCLNGQISLVPRMCPDIPFVNLWERRNVASIAEFNHTIGWRPTAANCSSGRAGVANTLQ
jgi:hypothetical protein